jgi:hypothetical protein
MSASGLKTKLFGVAVVVKVFRRRHRKSVTSGSIRRSQRRTSAGTYAYQTVADLLVLSMRSHGGISPKLAARCSINRRSFKDTCRFVG